MAGRAFAEALQDLHANYQHTVDIYETCRLLKAVHREAYRSVAMPKIDASSVSLLSSVAESLLVSLQPAARVSLSDLAYALDAAGHSIGIAINVERAGDVRDAAWSSLRAKLIGQTPARSLLKLLLERSRMAFDVATWPEGTEERNHQHAVILASSLEAACAVGAEREAMPVVMEHADLLVRIVGSIKYSKHLKELRSKMVGLASNRGENMRLLSACRPSSGSALRNTYCSPRGLRSLCWEGVFAAQ